MEEGDWEGEGVDWEGEWMDTEDEEGVERKFE